MIYHRGGAALEHAQCLKRGADVNLSLAAAGAARDRVEHIEIQREIVDRPLQIAGVGMRMRVDKAGHGDHAAAVDHTIAGRILFTADRGDLVVLNQNALAAPALELLVGDLGIFQQNAHGVLLTSRRRPSSGARD